MGPKVRGESSVANQRLHTGPSHGPPFRLCLLGGFELTANAQALEIPTSAQRVVAFLALHDRSLSRSFVAATCWPDVSEKRALASLRSTLWRLHRLGLTLVSASVDHVWLDPRVQVDYREVTGVARAILGSSGAAGSDELKLLHLDGALLPDCYEEWVIFERERLLQLRLHALERLSERLVAVGMFAEAVEAALAAVAGEPLRESAHRALIGVYLAEGNTVSAIRQYERYETLLSEELQLTPSSLMKELLAAFDG